MNAGNVAAVVVGLALFATPFLRYGVGGGHTGEGHMEHGARHGGQLLMVRNHHVELVERGAQLELYVSDMQRRPVRNVQGELRIDGRATPLRWESYRLVVDAPPPGARTDYAIHVPNSEALRFKYP